MCSLLNLNHSDKALVLTVNSPALRNYDATNSTSQNKEPNKGTHKTFKSLPKLIVSTNMWGEELYTEMGFFVQTILTDRYIHRTELRLVSLESSSSV